MRQAVEEGSAKPLGEHLEAQQATWLGAHLVTRSGEADPTLLVDFLAGCSAKGHAFSTQYYGCLQSHQGVRLSLQPLCTCQWCWQVSGLDNRSLCRGRACCWLSLLPHRNLLEGQACKVVK